MNEDASLSRGYRWAPAVLRCAALQRVASRRAPVPRERQPYCVALRCGAGMSAASLRIARTGVAASLLLLLLLLLSSSVVLLALSSANGYDASSSGDDESSSNSSSSRDESSITWPAGPAGAAALPCIPARHRCPRCFPLVYLPLPSSAACPAPWACTGPSACNPCSALSYLHMSLLPLPLPLLSPHSLFRTMGLRHMFVSPPHPLVSGMITRKDIITGGCTCSSMLLPWIAASGSSSGHQA